jgi:hypothetical protein|tara:strand:+ start:313 stop:510 length:198 start_codon:yes stop_codon:yes gene_type:complete
VAEFTTLIVHLVHLELLKTLTVDQFQFKLEQGELATVALEEETLLMQLVTVELQLLLNVNLQLLL